MPDPVAVLTAEAAALAASGQFAAATARCQQALQHRSRDPTALHLLGGMRYREGRLDEAAFLLSALLGVAPEHVGGLNDLACVALEQRRAADALPLLDRALAVEPGHADALFNRGNALLALDRPDEAADAFALSHAARPGDPRALNNLATIHRLGGRPEQALILVTEALAATPESALLQANLGTILQALGRAEAARAAFRLSLDHDAGNAEVWNNLATSLFEADRHAAAMDCLHQALALRPDFDVALFNLGNALVMLSRPEEAVAAYRRALAVRPDQPEAMHNLAGALMLCRDAEAAVPVFRRAIELVRARPDGGAGHRADGDRDDDRITFSLALGLLTLGDYAAGLAAYESRLSLSAVAPLQARHGIRPRWLGERALAGRTVLIHAEQGFGDSVQFCRFAPLLADLGARVLIEAPMPLLPLLRSLPGIAGFVAAGEDLPAFDLHCPMASLPLAFAARLDTIPAAVPYLAEAADRVARWRPEVAWDGRRRVGIAWSGNPGFSNDRWRTMALQTMAGLRGCGVALHVLQRDVRAADRAVLDGWTDLRDLSGAIVDFADTAALASLMDLVISVDTSVAHVAGAIGVPVWVLLPYAADWRWLREGARSRWYPTARLYRQSAPADWAGVIERVAVDLSRGDW